MKRLISIVALAMVMFWCGSAMALDTGACINFPHNWASNFTCEGLLDANEIAVLDPTDFAEHNISPVMFNSLPQPTVGGVVIDDYRLDNKRHSDGIITSRFFVHGTKGALSIPKIWKITVTEPQNFDCSDGPCDFMFGDENTVWPTYVYHTDWDNDSFVEVGFSDPIIPDGCNADGTLIDPNACATYNPDTCPEGGYTTPPFTAYCDYVNTFPGDTDPVGGGLCYDINSAVECSPDYSSCPDCNPQPTCTAFVDPFDFEDPTDDKCGYYLPEMIAVGGSPLLMSDIVNVSSSLGSALPYFEENEVASILKYNTGDNQLPDVYGANYILNDSIFFHPFGNFHFPVGDHIFTLNLVGGETVELPVNVFSNEVMPTVTAFTQGLVFDKVKKSGKVVTKEKEITVVNIQAREITDLNGDTRLLIQWAEPDGAMMLVNPTRLRIYVGNDWKNGPTVKDMSFLSWMFQCNQVQ